MHAISFCAAATSRSREHSEGKGQLETSRHQAGRATLRGQSGTGQRDEYGSRGGATAGDSMDFGTCLPGTGIFAAIRGYQSTREGSRIVVRGFVWGFLRAAFRPAGNECGIESASASQSTSGKGTWGARTFRKLRVGDARDHWC